MGENVTNIILYHSLIVFGELLIFISLVHMLYKRRTPASMTAWLLSMVLMPYLFVVLYFIFGSRKHIEKYKKNNIEPKEDIKNPSILNPTDEIIRSCGGFTLRKDQEFKLFTNPIEAYRVFMDSIQGAKKSIYISTYVLKLDKTGKSIMDALAKKAKSGVDVKILVDSIGSWRLYFDQHKLKGYRDNGVAIGFFMPALKMPFRNYINLRNHRKIYLFDDSFVLSGGMNIADEYLGADEQKERWEDMLFLSKGRSVMDFFEVFASDWFYASSKYIEFKNQDLLDGGDTHLQVVPSGPDMQKDALYEALLCAIYEAKKRIWIISPYFVPNDSLSQALIVSAHKGVDVKIITPKNSNHITADLTRSSFMRDLEDEGVEIWLYEGVMLHAKAILFDEDAVMLGSVNFDNRSLFLNYDIATFVYSKRVIKDTFSWMRGLLENSQQGTKKASSIRIISENFMRIFAPVM